MCMCVYVIEEKEVAAKNYIILGIAVIFSLMLPTW